VLRRLKGGTEGMGGLQRICEVEGGKGWANSVLLSGKKLEKIRQTLRWNRGRNQDDSRKKSGRYIS